MFRMLLAVLLSLSRLYAGDLNGRVAIVTGGSRGIGKACCLALAQQGAKVAVVYNQREVEADSVVQVIQTLGGDAMSIQCDVSQASAVTQLVAQVMQRWGQIDILVNNAGIVSTGSAETLSLADWQRMLDVNLTGPFLCAQAVGQQMMAQGNGGSIINISSVSAHVVIGPQKQSHYNASKAGVGMLTKSLAVEWAPYGIRVNAISPGYIRTEMLQYADQYVPKWIANTPLNVIGQPDDIAEAVVFLATDRSKFVTGSDWIIDGGYTCP